MLQLIFVGRLLFFDHQSSAWSIFGRRRTGLLESGLLLAVERRTGVILASPLFLRKVNLILNRLNIVDIALLLFSSYYHFFFIGNVL